MTTNLDFNVAGASGNAAQRSRQNLEDRAARDLLFQGAEGRVTSAENYLESSRRNRQMNEAGAYADAAKLLAGMAGPQGPTESMAALGAAEELGQQASRTRATGLQAAADSIYAAEDAVSQAQMGLAETRKGASVYAEREVKLNNFITTMNGIRTDMENGVLDGDQAWRQISALLELEQDPVLRQSMMMAWQGGGGGNSTPTGANAMPVNPAPEVPEIVY